MARDSTDFWLAQTRAGRDKAFFDLHRTVPPSGERGDGNEVLTEGEKRKSLAAACCFAENSRIMPKLRGASLRLVRPKPSHSVRCADIPFRGSRGFYRIFGLHRPNQNRTERWPGILRTFGLHKPEPGGIRLFSTCTEPCLPLTREGTETKF